MAGSHRETYDQKQNQTKQKNKKKVKPSSRFALFTELMSSLSPYKQITDTGLKLMKHIITHELLC